MFFCIVPLESLRLGFRISLCPELLHLLDSFVIYHAQLHPTGWSFLVCFVYLCRLVVFSALPGLFSQVFVILKFNDQSNSSPSRYYIKSSLKNTSSKSSLKPNQIVDTSKRFHCDHFRLFSCLGVESFFEKSPPNDSGISIQKT